MEIDFNFSRNISSINKDQFDLMINENDSPFINYDFLRALEESSSVSETVSYTHLRAHETQ